MTRIPDEMRPQAARTLFRHFGVVLAPADPGWTYAIARENMAAFETHASELIAQVTAHDERRPPIYVDHIVDTAFNALACPWQNSFLILPTGVCWAWFASTFNSLLSMPEVWPDVGDCGVETPPAFTASGIDPVHAHLAGLKLPLLDPVDPLRRRVADALCTQAFEFLVLHELGHIRNGHLSAVPGKNGLAELTPVGAWEAASLTRQTLEMDADSHAVVHTLRNAFILSMEVARLAPTLNAAEPDHALLLAMYGSHGRTLRTCLTVYYVLFRLLSPAAWTADTLWSRSHPPAMLRLLMMLGVIDGKARLTPDPAIAALSGERLASIVGRLAVELELGLCRVFGIDSDPLAVLEPSLRALGAYQHQLLVEWARLHPALDKAKLGGKLAPPQV